MVKRANSRDPRQMMRRAQLTPSWPTGQRLVLLQALAIVAVATAIFWPALRGDWLWDDYIDLSENKITRSASGLWSIWFVPGSQIDYYPVKATVQWIQWHLWGNDTFGYHVTNLVLHIVSALLAWRLFGKLGLRFAWLGGLLFAIHPAQVESVAWIAELKNTLSMPFFLLAAIYYLDYDDKKRRGDYLAALGFFLVAMLTKPTMVMWPFVMLLHAWWKRHRIERNDLRTSVPFFLVSLVIGIVTLRVGHWYVELHPHENVSASLGGFLPRLARTGISLAFYFWKAVWPVGLLPIYSRWQVDPPSLIQFWPWPVLAAVFAACWATRAGRGPHLLFGLGFFTLMILPFCGFLPNDYMRFTSVMDHFLYIPLLGVIGLAVAGINELEQRLSPAARAVERVAIALLLTALAWGSREYAAKFAREETLWIYTQAGNPSAWPAHVNYGNALVLQGRYDEAIHEFQETLRLNPGYAEAESNWATTLFQMGHADEALGHFERAAQFDPSYFNNYYDWGGVLLRMGRTQEAVAKFEEAARLKPDDSSVRNNLGVGLVQLGRKAEAAAQFQEALRLDPDNQQAALNLRGLTGPPALQTGK